MSILKEIYLDIKGGDKTDFALVVLVVIFLFLVLWLAFFKGFSGSVYEFKTNSGVSCIFAKSGYVGGLSCDFKNKNTNLNL